MSSLKALVLSGEGINCERETAFALQKAGFEVQISTVNELSSAGFSQDGLKKQFSVLALPGGFSYGDHLGSGRVLAIKIKRQLNLDLHQFARSGGMVIGICNGFQALIRLGTFGKNISITRNASDQFMDKWVSLKKDTHNASPWLKSVGELDLPIRHGEGRLISELKIEDSKTEFTAALRYQEDVNGSLDRIAGLTTAEGRIFGLMPHPEAFVRWTQYPTWTQDHSKTSADGHGLQFFNNAYSELKKGN